MGDAVLRTNRLRKSCFFLLAFVVEMATFAILPLSYRVPVNQLLPIHAGIAAALLATALLLRRSERGKQYWLVSFALFVAGVAVLSSTLFSARILGPLGLIPSSPAGMAVAKLSESFCRVIPILVLMASAGVDRGAMYLRKGRLALGLGVGTGGFIAFAALAYIPLAKQPGISDTLLSLAPWILMFVLANGFGEELLFRGLLLGRYEPFLGKGLSNLLAALVFTLLHLPVTYVPQVLQFLVVVFPLALLWGYLMQKTDSLWGSALFHAGADCMIVLAVFAKA